MWLAAAADYAGYNHTSWATSAGQHNKQGAMKCCFVQLLKEIYLIRKKITEWLSKEKDNCTQMDPIRVHSELRPSCSTT